MERKFLMHLIGFVALLLLSAFSIISSACEPYFHMSITNKTQEELVISVLFDPPYGGQVALGTLPAGKTIRKQFDFSWFLVREINVTGSNSDGKVVYYRMLTLEEFGGVMRYKLNITEDPPWFIKP